MMLSSIKIKGIIALIVVLAVVFYNNVFLKDVFVQKGISVKLETSPLEGLVKSKNEDISNSTLFGIYQKKNTVEPKQVTEIEKLFTDEKNTEFIGTIGNFQYLLYATADVSGKLSANVLVKNLDTETVSLSTVVKGEPLANSIVTDIKLNSIGISNGKTDLNLKLFSSIRVNSQSSL